MWKMLQRKVANDYVISTGKQFTVKQFVNYTLDYLKMSYKWKCSGVNSKCFNKNGKCFIESDKEYYRPLEVDTLLGNSSKARKELKWKPKINIKSLVKDMVDSELIKLRNDNKKF